MKVSAQNLRNAADFMKQASGVDPNWLREAADEIDRLRSIAIERMDLFRQAATEVERLTDALQQMLTDPPAALDEPDTDAEVIAKMRKIARAALLDQNTT